MKTCVVEIRGKMAAVLTDEGCIIKVKNRNYAIGQVIELKKQAIHFSVKTAAVAASVAIVMLLGSVTAWAYYTPCTYVSLDVNPSIEYSVNRFDRVLSAQAVNSDGAEILSDLSLNNMTIDEAIRDTVDQIQSEGYFKDSGGIVISTSGDDAQAAQGLAEELKDAAEAAVKDSGAVEVEAISVGRERVLEAQKLGTTPGRLNLVQKLQASAGEENVDLQEWLKKPVKDIMKAIKTAKKQSKSDSSGSDTVSSLPAESSASSAEAASSSEAESQAASSQTQSSTAKQAGKSASSAASPAKKTQANASGNTSSKSNGTSSKANSSSVDKNTPKNGKSSSDASSAESSASSSGESTTSVDSSSDSAVKDNNGNSAENQGSNGNGGSGNSNNGSGKSNSGKGNSKK